MIVQNDKSDDQCDDEYEDLKNKQKLNLRNLVNFSYKK